MHLHESGSYERIQASEYTCIQHVRMVRGKRKSNATYSFVHDKIRRTDGMVSVDNQLVVIQMLARLSIHLVVKTG